MPVTVHPAFAVPFGEAYHPDPAALNAKLRALILELEAMGAGYRNPDPVVHQPEGLFESEFEFFAREEPCVQELRQWVWPSLAEFIRSINPTVAENPAGLRIASQTWFHVTRDGGYFGYHNHPMASWSGVYCVSAGEDDGTNPDSGALHFANPLHLANMFIDAANRKLRPPYSMAGKSFKLKPGQLVLFPSWVNHEVLPFYGRGERITVAFNTWFNLPAEEEKRA